MKATNENFTFHRFFIGLAPVMALHKCSIEYYQKVGIASKMTQNSAFNIILETSFTTKLPLRNSISPS